MKAPYCRGAVISRAVIKGCAHREKDRAVEMKFNMRKMNFMNDSGAYRDTALVNERHAREYCICDFLPNSRFIKKKKKKKEKNKLLYKES